MPQHTISIHKPQYRVADKRDLGAMLRLAYAAAKRLKKPVILTPTYFGYAVESNPAKCQIVAAEVFPDGTANIPT